MKGIVAGYGVNNDWILEYETMLGRKLKTFTVADSNMVDFLEVKKLQGAGKRTPRDRKKNSNTCAGGWGYS